MQSFKSFIAGAIATVCGVGFTPLAPGTAGTLVAVPLVYWLNGESLIFRVFFLGVILWLGSWAANIFDKSRHTRDNSHIVIDEVLGYAVAAWSVGMNPRGLAAAFVLFRFFDIFKLPPVKQLDQWSKKKGAGGFSVMADDLVAGLQAWGVLFLLKYFFPLLTKF